MRQIGNLDSEVEAQRFTAFLVTQGVNAHTEQDSDGWVIWVRDEDQLQKARSEMDQFCSDPEAERYQGVEKQAESLRREQVKRREQVRKNVVEMGGRWKQHGTGRRTPLVITLIGLSIFATIWTGFGQNARTTNLLSFCTDENVESPLANIKQGQIWRLVTPIFMHGGRGGMAWIMHLGFNMYLLYIFGTLIESQRGILRFAALVLVIAVISNVAQALLENPRFLGMSGVVYGLFGYCWMKTLYDPGAGIFISRQTIVFLVIWFFICLFLFQGSVANMAHGAGLVVGVVIGYVPVLLRGG